MLTPDEAEELYARNQSLLDRIMEGTANRYQLPAGAAAEFRTAVKRRLVEDEYALLRRWRGDCRLATYLTVVVAQVARGFRVEPPGQRSSSSHLPPWLRG